MMGPRKHRRFRRMPATLLACFLVFSSTAALHADDAPADDDQPNADDGAVEQVDPNPPPQPMQLNPFANNPNFITAQGPNGPIIFRRNPINGGWEQFEYRTGEQQIRFNVQQFLQNSQDNLNAWKWRDTVEEQLVSLGESALPILQDEMKSRDGYAADALMVAAFRLEHPGLRPNDELRDWAVKYFVPAGTAAPALSPDAIRIMRVLGIRDAFPNHLFYVLEQTTTHRRVVVALASDGKVQALEDNDALARFFREEDHSEKSAFHRAKLGAVAALLALSRTVSVYKPDSVHGDVPRNEAKICVESASAKLTASLTFDAAGKVETITTDETREVVPAAPPVVVPTSGAPPPPIPD